MCIKIISFILMRYPHFVIILVLSHMFKEEIRNLSLVLLRYLHLFFENLFFYINLVFKFLNGIGLWNITTIEQVIGCSCIGKSAVNPVGPPNRFHSPFLLKIIKFLYFYFYNYFLIYFLR